MLLNIFRHYQVQLFSDELSLFTPFLLPEHLPFGIPYTSYNVFAERCEKNARNLFEIQRKTLRAQMFGRLLSPILQLSIQNI